MIERQIKNPPYVEILYVCKCGQRRWVSGYKLSATCPSCGQVMSLAQEVKTIGHPGMDEDRVVPR